MTDVNEKDYEYIKNKALLVCELSDDIDEKINLVSEGWPVDRIGKAELAIMRLAVYEMLYDDDIPVNVAINEAVELAKVMALMIMQHHCQWCSCKACIITFAELKSIIKRLRKRNDGWSIYCNTD